MMRLASCQWGPATTLGVCVLTEMYVIYMERDASRRAVKSVGPTVLTLQACTNGLTNGFVGNIYG